MSRKPRHLSAEERALWDRVARTADPLPKRDTSQPVAVEAQKPPVTSDPRPWHPPRFEIGARGDTAAFSFSAAPSPRASLDDAALRMDARAHRRLRSGKLRPEARIDLHGMTANRARGVLADFVLRAQAEGRRLVLVITGKGRRDRGDDPVPARTGVLRHEVPRWLSLPPLAGAVLQVVPAHRRHGGDGAYYVYLARSGRGQST